MQTDAERDSLMENVLPSPHAFEKLGFGRLSKRGAVYLACYGVPAYRGRRRKSRSEPGAIEDKFPSAKNIHHPFSSASNKKNKVDRLSTLLFQ